jgi:2-amino-4-hydroxy-6-hydroxymethyldihydropteridine diphosphokinase
VTTPLRLLAPLARCITLGLGSNVGDRRANLKAALGALGEYGVVTRCSSLYESSPVGVVDQSDFLNAVCLVDTALNLGDLLKAAKAIEWTIGRRPGLRWGPRPIDIDLLLAGEETLDTADLVVPHQRLAERAFVLVPLAEIAPSAPHPRLHRTMQALLKALPAEEIAGVRRVVGPEWGEQARR